MKERSEAVVDGGCMFQIKQKLSQKTESLALVIKTQH